MFDLGVVVPVRRGSSRIAEKCALPFGEEETLIEWKLRQLIAVIDPDRIYLSSEDVGFLDIAQSLGVSIHQREPHLAIGHAAPFSDVITGIVKDIPHQHIAWCTVVCPLMAPREYCSSFRDYHQEVIAGPHDSLLGVYPEREYVWSKEGPLNYEASRNHTISQDLPEWFKVTNSIYMASRDIMLKRSYFLGDNPFLKPLSKLSAIDIDFLDDYRFARALYSIYVEDSLDQLEPQSRIDWGYDEAA